jgi:thioester reductase-like protein
MVPRVWVVLDSLPLGPTGKLDRRALPSPAHGPRQLVRPRTDTERVLVRIVGETLAVDPVSVSDHLISLGADSLAAIQLISRVRETLGVEITLRALYECESIASLAASIDSTGVRSRAGLTEPRSAPDLEKDARLDPAIRFGPVTFPRAVDETGIVFTGATGFLGAYLLHELLDRTSSTVYCLVRANTDKEACGRLADHLRRLELPLWKEGRVHAFATDLSRPRFGLDQARYDQLAALAGVIYHGGAHVDFSLPYERLKPVNVDGTHEIIRLAAYGGASQLHFISSIGVFPRFGWNGMIVSEDTCLRHRRALETGYQQSKWVAEALVQVARDRGVPATVYRPGNISGDSRTGRWRTTDFAVHLLRACIEHRILPDIETTIEFTPVDFVARAVAALSLAIPPGAPPYHVLSPNGVSGERLAKWLTDLGYSVDLLPYGRWRDRLLESAYARDGRLGLFADLLPDADEVTRPSRFENTRSRERLDAASVVCPAVDQRLIAAYVRYLIDVRFLPSPG